MYAWKCWRETRARFFVLLTLSFVSVALFARVLLGPQPVGVFGEVHTLTPYEVGIQLKIFVMMAVICFGCIVIPGGFLLGSTAMGSEIELGTVEYLWTRPRSRSSLIVTHWAVCATELVAVAVIPTIVILLAVGVRYGDWSNWRLLLAALLEVLPGIMFLGLTVLMTAIRKNAVSGLIFSLGITFGYLGTIFFISKYTRWHVPWPMIFDWSTQYARNPVAKLLPPFPWGATARMGILAFVFMLVANRLMKRAEI